MYLINLMENDRTWMSEQGINRLDGPVAFTDGLEKRDKKPLQRRGLSQPWMLAALVIRAD